MVVRESLEARADTGDRYARWQLAKLLIARGDLASLERRADAGDRHAAWQLAYERWPAIGPPLQAERRGAIARLRP